MTAEPLAVLTWDTGDRVAVYGRTVFGRNPVGDAETLQVAVRDETLSLSKTHFEIGGDADGTWLRDHSSRNGTVLVRGDERMPLWPLLRTPLRAGDRLEFGDRVVTVSGVL